MTRLALFRSPEFTLVADRPIIKADQVGALDDAVGMLRRAAKLRETLDAECAMIRERACEEGRQQGLAQGRQQAAQAIGAALAGVDRRLERDRADAQARVVQLALAVVERIAGELGPATVVSAIAGRVLAEIDPPRSVRVKVNATLAEAVRRQLGAGAGRIQVIGTEGLGPFDCELDTEQGRIEAGLPLQLEAIGLALAAAVRVSSDATAAAA
jgi:flagellar biosynthesis/type III secretory pathway protein FliH